MKNLQRFSGWGISADAIVSTVKHWELDMACLVGQGYDGAAVMSSSKNGVQSKIPAQYPNATYIH